MSVLSIGGLMKKHVKKILLGVGAIMVVLILVAVSYVIYVVASYSRIENNLVLTAHNNQSAELSMDTEYEILTYNIGFGAYSKEYSFFLDKGVMQDGKKVAGKYGKGINKEDVLHNTNGAIGIMNNLNYDFILAQEVDEDGDRSYHVNQLEMIKNTLSDYGSVYAKNFHSAHLYYPFNDPHGKTDSAGIVTMSKYRVASAARYSLPISDGLSKFFDLDRCFSVSRLPLGEKEFVLINVHLSAYDEGGKIRAQQLKMLCDFLKKEYDKGNYVLAGGDFNHDICNSAGTFETQQKEPDWLAKLSGEELPQGFSFAVADNKDTVPTCRSSDISYEKGVNYTVIIDGFIVSDNIEIVSVENQDTDFIFSDHNPVHMKFIFR